MKTNKKALIEELTVSLAPYFSSKPDAEPKLPKSMAKTVERLAEQILQLRTKQQKKVAQVAPRAARQALTDELAGLLDSHLHEAGDEQADKVARVITKTAEQLAGKLTKLRSRSAEAVTEPGEDAPASEETPTSEDTLAAKPQKRTTPRRRSAAPGA